MSPAPGDRPDGHLDAIPTQWSLVRTAHAAGAPQTAIEARQALVLRYAKAVRRYIGAVTKSAEDADELAQEVVVRLMKGDFGGADPARGRFRDLLKSAVRNMTRSHGDKAKRRRGAGTDLSRVAAPDEADPDWDAGWRQTVLDHAWAALQDHERDRPGPPTYTLLRLRVASPEATSEQLAAQLAVKTGAPVRADACRQMLRRARLRFAELLVAELRSGLVDPSPERLADELAALGLTEFVKDFLPDGWNTGAPLRE